MSPTTSPQDTLEREFMSICNDAYIKARESLEGIDCLEVEVDSGPYLWDGFIRSLPGDLTPPEEKNIMDSLFEEFVDAFWSWFVDNHKEIWDKLTK